MAKRVRFTSPVECPKCGATGRGEWEENENPDPGLERGLGRTLFRMPYGFSRRLGDRRADPALMCEKCGAKAYNGSD